MRVDFHGATKPVRPSTLRAGVSGARFSLSDIGTPASVSSPAQATRVSALDALLALQSESDATERRKRVVRRGHALLDALEGLKLAALSGAGGAADLDRLGQTLRQDETAADEPALGALIDEIELRAAVEIAKRTRR